MRKALFISYALTLFSVGFLAAEADYGCCPQYNQCGEFSVHADYLYWRACTDGQAVAREEHTTGTFIRQNPKNNQTSIFSAFDRRGKLKQFPDRWESGFRVGLGYKPACSCSDLALNWINFEPDGSKTVIADEGYSVIPYPGFNLERILATEFSGPFGVDQGFDVRVFGEIELVGSMVHGKWKLCLDVVDLEFGQDFNCCGCLNLRPHASLRYASIDQHLRIDTEGTTSAFPTAPTGTTAPNSLEDDLTTSNWTSEKRLKSDFDGVGPRVGLDAEVALGCQFGVYGNLAVALLYGDRKSSIKETAARISILDPTDGEGFVTTGDAISEDFDCKNTNNRRCSSAILDTAVGLFWNKGHCMCGTNYDFGVKIGWEHHYFFNQSVADAAANNNFFREENTDLSTQGLTVALSVGF